MIKNESKSSSSPYRYFTEHLISEFKNPTQECNKNSGSSSIWSGGSRVIPALNCNDQKHSTIKLKSRKIEHRQLTIKRQAPKKQNQRWLFGAEHNMQNTTLQIYQDKPSMQNCSWDMASEQEQGTIFLFLLVLSRTVTVSENQDHQKT
jgi:hypothetical protein